MVTINGDLLGDFLQYQVSMIGVFVPIVTIMAGTFMAFAIADRLRFLIQKLLKK